MNKVKNATIPFILIEANSVVNGNTIIEANIINAV